MTKPEVTAITRLELHGAPSPITPQIALVLYALCSQFIRDRTTAPSPAIANDAASVSILTFDIC
jgi:hypothetical protein